MDRLKTQFASGATDDEKTFELSVSNSGDPSPPAALERLFQPFTRGAVRPDQQGLGLGLYIVSEVAKAHGGTLDVVSTAEETRYTFRMPVRTSMSE
jgi:signal transduction histidine kinase